MPGKQAEKTFRQASNPAINRPGKQGERDGSGGTYLERNPSGKDKGKEMDRKEGKEGREWIR